MASKWKFAAGLFGAYAAFRAWRSVATELRSRRLPKRTRFVILGAGFGGVNAALELARQLPYPKLGEIQLVDEQPFLLFTPMLTEVAGGELDARHIVAPPHKLSDRVTFVRGRVEKIDVNSRRVTVNLGDSTQVIEADHLVLALGSVNKYHHIPGIEQHSLTIKNIDEAIAIRNRVIQLVERASIETNEEARREMLTFVTGGGGYTGVETMAAVNDLARRTAKEFPGIDARSIRCILVEPGDRLMPETSPELAEYARKKLEKGGIEVRLKTGITAAGQGWIDVAGGQRLQARTLIWAGGVRPNPLIATLECKRGKHGGVIVNDSCEVPERRGVWALGDCAEVPEAPGRTYAPTAQNATREGRHVAQNIVRDLLGEPLRPFRYKPLGELALVGRHKGVARIYGMEFSGLPAWALWRAIYLSKMPEMSQRFRIAFDWLLDMAFGRNLAATPKEDITSIRSYPHEDKRIGPAHSAAG